MKVRFKLLCVFDSKLGIIGCLPMPFGHGFGIPAALKALASQLPEGEHGCDQQTKSDQNILPKHQNPADQYFINTRQIINENALLKKPEVNI